MSESRVYLLSFGNIRTISTSQIKSILKAKMTWKIVSPASSTTAATDSSSEVVDTTKETVSEEEANDIACSVILQGLNQVPFTAVMQYQDYTRKV